MEARHTQAEEVHCWRPRRSAFGELVQWDSAEHVWLGGRGQVRFLVGMIDDATSWSWAALSSAMPRRTTWVCCGSTWGRMAGWWMCIRIGIRCSRRRHGPERATLNSVKQTA